MLDNFISKFSSIAASVGKQRHLCAVRDGFVTIMPLMIIGSLVLLINNFPLGTGADGGKSLLQEVLSEIPALKWIVTMDGNIWWGAFALISLFSVATIAYSLAKSYEANSLSAAVVSLAVYLSFVPQTSQDFVTEAGENLGGLWGNINWSYLSANSLFVAILIAICATEVFVRLSKSPKLIINMPAGVPPSVSRSFAALLPSMITILIFGIMGALLNTYANTDLFAIVNGILVAPLKEASGTLGFGIVVVLFTHIFWVFGIHGASIFEGILQPFNVTAVANNMQFLNGEADYILIFNKSFADAFCYMGGTGVGLGIVIALLIMGKSKQNRMMGRLGAAPAVFNINEPILFGLPIVMNPIFAVPFILAPLVCLFIAFFATKIGFLPPVCYVIPWTTPPIVSGLFATGFAWQAPVIQIVNLAVSVLIYIPFVKIADNIEAKREAEAEAQEKAEAEANANAGA